MTRVVATLAVALLMLGVGSTADAAQKRAYKPAERRAQEAEAQPAQDAEPAVAPTYEEELRVAKEKRDKELQDVAAGETDQRTLEKKKQEIFAQYAAIVAALRDKYAAAHPDDQTAPGAGKKRAGSKTTRGKSAATDGPAKKKPAKGRDAASELADAQEKLAEENTRHTAKMEQLNAQLAEAKTSESQREIRRVEKAIEKENNSYNARKTILERRVVELGGSISPPPAAPVIQ